MTGSAVLSRQQTATATRFRKGTIVDRYRLVRYLGRGQEGTVYLAEELTTGIRRAIKFFRYTDPALVRSVSRMVRWCEQLRDTAAVPRYHGLGYWLHPSGQLFIYVTFSYLDGPLLSAVLVNPRRHSWSAETAFAILQALAAKLAALHAHGYAVNDFDDGNNLILVGGSDPVFCDLEVRHSRDKRGGYADDLAVYSDILKMARRHWPVNGRLRQLRAILAEAEGRRVTRSTFRTIHSRLIEV